MVVCFRVYSQGRVVVSAHSCWYASAFSFACAAAKADCLVRKEKKDYAFSRQFNEKPSIKPGCPGDCLVTISAANWWSWYPAEMGSGPKWLHAALGIPGMPCLVP